MEGGQRCLARAGGERGGETAGDDGDYALPLVELLAVAARAPLHERCRQDESTVYPANVPVHAPAMGHGGITDGVGTQRRGASQLPRRGGVEPADLAQVQVADADAEEVGTEGDADARATYQPEKGMVPVGDGEPCGDELERPP
eukprot:448993-Rhodomonas_salina.1